MKIATNDTYNVNSFRYTKTYNVANEGAFYYSNIVNALHTNKFILCIGYNVYVTTGGQQYNFNTIIGLFNGNIELWLNGTRVATLSGQSLWYKDSGGNSVKPPQMYLYN